MALEKGPEAVADFRGGMKIASKAIPLWRQVCNLPEVSTSCKLSTPISY
jgi:hypothetical protein